jgi:diguanylate cyclase (GGDEF)-like protein/PAS domain S-box-containing protein
MRDVVYMVGLDGTFTSLNPAFEAVTGWKREEWIGRHITEILHPDDVPGVVEEFQRNLGGRRPPIFERRVRSKSGEYLVGEFALAPLFRKGNIVGILGTARDVTGRKRAEAALRELNEELLAKQRTIEDLNRNLEARVRARTEELRRSYEKLRERNRQLMDARAQAATDALTGLGNHRAFQQRIRLEVSKAKEVQSGLALVMLDIDGFKEINDSRGHLAGDEVLHGIAVVVSDAAGRGDVYRYGGDEFAALLPGSDCPKARLTADKIRRAVETWRNGIDARVTVSLGVASLGLAATSAEELIYGADAAMYWAKSAGKNRVGDSSRLAYDRSGAAADRQAALASTDATRRQS